MTFEITENVAAPERSMRATRQKRLTGEIKNMQPGQSVAPLDFKTKQAFCALARYNGWEFATKKIDGQEAWRAWRLKDKEEGKTGETTPA